MFAATEGLWFQIANGKLMVPNLPRLLAKECAYPHAISTTGASAPRGSCGGGGGGVVVVVVVVAVVVVGRDVAVAVVASSQ